MKYYDSKGLEVEITETDGGYREAFIISAEYLDDRTDPTVSDDELDFLQEKYAEEISDGELQKSIGAAEDAFEGDR